MAWRFRRSLKLIPGVRINFSKSGVSTTIGVPGAHINLGRKGTYLSTGIPGTGIYRRDRILNNSGTKRTTEGSEQDDFVVQPNPDLTIIQSKDDNSITSLGLEDLRERTLAAFREQEELKKELARANTELSHNKFVLIVAKILSLGGVVFHGWVERRENAVRELMGDCDEINKRIAGCNVKIEIDHPPELGALYDAVVESFVVLSSSGQITNIVGEQSNVSAYVRTTATLGVATQPVAIGLAKIDFIDCPHQGLKFTTAWNRSLYVYPGFIVIFSKANDFALIAYEDVHLEYSAVKMIIQGTVPQDTKVVSQTWRYANKNGDPDRRYKNNYQLPVGLFGNLKFTSERGMNEAFQFSNAESVTKFAAAFEAYRNAILPQAASIESAPKSTTDKKT